MSEAEDKLGAILGNPQLMQQIMSLAQSMNQQNAQPAPPPPVPAPSPPSAPRSVSPSGMPTEMDMTLLKKFTGFARQSSIDKDQQALLHALSPYLSQERVNKLERAMHAAKIAQMASTFLNAGGMQLFSGR